MPRGFWSAMPPAARVALAAIVGFLIGFGWQFARAHALQGRLDAATRDLRLARAEALLAVAVSEAQRGDLDAARGQASAFYTQAQQAVTAARVAHGGDAELPAPEAGLVGLLQERDSLIVLLSRNDSTATPRLVRQLAALRGLLQGTGAPGPAGAAGPP